MSLIQSVRNGEGLWIPEKIACLSLSCAVLGGSQAGSTSVFIDLLGYHLDEGFGG